jgi:hypothetical protein
LSEVFLTNENIISCMGGLLKMSDIEEEYRPVYRRPIWASPKTQIRVFRAETPKLGVCTIV